MEPIALGDERELIACRRPAVLAVEGRCARYGPAFVISHPDELNIVIVLICGLNSEVGAVGLPAQRVVRRVRADRQPFEASVSEGR
jgi:hypothetical protein